MAQARAAAILAVWAAWQPRLLCTSAAGDVMPDQLAAAERLAEYMLQRLTFEEKVGLVHGLGYGTATIGEVPGVPRLGIPTIRMNDGPQGFRTDRFIKCPTGSSTQYPSGLTIAATWDPSLAEAWGSAMGREFAAKGANLQLGPAMDVVRFPRAGRNFESVSGEDPFLGRMLAAAAVRGIQGQGVLANAKHFIANNQEENRHAVNVQVSERALREIYLPPFEGAIAAGVGSIMCSYNYIWGRPACAQNATLVSILRRDLGFKGWVMSDWEAVGSYSVLDGLDQMMPGWTVANPQYLNQEPFAPALDRAVGRILAALLAVRGLDDARADQGMPLPALDRNTSTAASMATAQLLSERATVLLKNDGDLLPLPARSSSLRRIVLFGGDALSPTTACGRGSSGFVDPSYLPAPIRAMGDHLERVRRSGGAAAAQEVPVLEFQTNPAGNDTVAVVFISTFSAEGLDRPSLSFGGGDDLVASVAAQQPKTVVVAVSPGAVLMPWAAAVPAILAPLLPGQMFGEAITRLLFGAAAPSGRLPVTMPSRENEMEMSPEQYPGGVYSEELEVGYRWYDAHGVRPLFPFGHGLSYTTFEYGPLAVEAAAASGAALRGAAAVHGPARRVSLDLANSGRRDGVEVVQLYLGFPPDAGEPPKVLAGFQPVSLAPAAARRVRFELSERDLSIWDVGARRWRVACGEFNVLVGASSRDIRQVARFVVGPEFCR